MDGDGERERDGEALRLQALGSEELLVILQSQLREVGALLEITPLSNAVRRQRIASGDFDFFLGSAQISVPGTRDMMGYLAHPDRYKSRHSMWTMGASDLSNLAAQLDSTIQPDLRAELISGIWDLWLQELPATPLVPSISGTVAHTRVRGLSSPHRTLATTFIDELWIDEKVDSTPAAGSQGGGS
jgi:ABC-type transport system substrate-binding protein